MNKSENWNIGVDDVVSIRMGGKVSGAQQNGHGPDTCRFESYLVHYACVHEPVHGTQNNPGLRSLTQE